MSTKIRHSFKRDPPALECPAVERAAALFPGSVMVDEDGERFDAWFKQLRSRLSSLLWDEALVICPHCDGKGCNGGLFPECEDGRIPFGYVSTRGESRVELATRLLINAIYSAPEYRPWVERAIDIFCAKWESLHQERKAKEAQDVPF